MSRLRTGLCAVMSAAGILILSGCAADTSEATTLSVEAAINVCDEDLCFAAPIPEAEVTVDDGTSADTRQTDDQGNARFEVESDLAVVTVVWGSHSATVEVGISPGDTTITVRLPETASTD